MLATALLVGSTLMSTTPGEDARPADATPSASAAPTAPPIPAGDAAVCAATATSESSDPPPDLRWMTSESSAKWPVSDSVGPTGERDRLPACFDSSPMGATLAAVTFLFEQVDRSPLQTYPTYVANTVGKDVAIRSLNGHSDAELQEVMRTPGVETVGYRIDSWSAGRASVTVALRLPDTDALAGWPLELVRVSGDWLVKLRPDGTVGDPAPIDPADTREWPRPTD